MNSVFPDNTPKSFASTVRICPNPFSTTPSASARVLLPLCVPVSKIKLGFIAATSPVSRRADPSSTPAVSTSPSILSGHRGSTMNCFPLLYLFAPIIYIRERNSKFSPGLINFIVLLPPVASL